MGMKIKQNWIFYLCLLLCSFCLVCFYGGMVPYLIFYTVLCIPVVGFFYVIYVMKHFKLYQSVEGRDFVKGEPIHYTFQIANEDVIYYDDIEVKFDSEYAMILGMQESMTFHLKPGQQEEVKTKIVCNYRGKYQVGIKDYYVSDFLKLYRLHGRLTTSVNLIIKPRIVPLEQEDLLFEKNQGNRTKTAKSEGEQGNEIRTYMPGDSMRNVHWKASAKTGELKVREMEKNCGNSFLVVLDGKPDEKTGILRIAREDAYIERMVSLVYECYKRGILVRVLYWEDGIRVHEINSAGSWNAFYRKSGTMEFQCPYPVEELQVPMEELMKVRQIVYITENESPAFQKKVEELKHAGIQVLVLKGK